MRPFVFPGCFPTKKNDWSKAVIQRLRNEEQQSVVPAHWLAEISNGLVFGVRRKRIKAEQDPRFWDELAMLPVDIQPAITLTEAQHIVALSEKHRLTVYDAIYLYLAQRQNITLGTLDRELIRAAKAEGLAVL